MNFYLLLGLISAFTFYSLIDGGENKEPLLFKRLFVTINRKKYHLHHWMIFLTLLLVQLPIIFHYGYNKLFATSLGICLGSITQGLSYNDAFHFTF